MLVLACLSLQARAQCDQTVFGFKKYQKTSNGSETFQDSFPAADPTHNFSLIVFNGLSGANRISRGTVSVNGVEIAGPSEFNQQIDSFERPIGSLQTNNQITIVLQRGDPQGFIVLRIVDRGSGVTSLSGSVFSTTDSPLERVELTVGRVTAATDRDGNFLLDSVPCGSQKVRIDASKVKGNKTYASVNEVLFLTEGVQNHLERPLYLPEIDLANAVSVPAQVTQDIVVSNPDLAGVSLRIKAGTTVIYPDGASSGMVSITEVPTDRTPLSLPPELDPSVVITVQPEGVVLSEPAEVVYPNTDNLPVGAKVELMSLSPGSGKFVTTGMAAVDAGGASLIAEPTSGLSAFDWHLWAPPGSELENPNPDHEDCPCSETVGSEAGLFDGALLTQHSLPSHFSLGQSRAVALNYNSLAANPRPILGLRTAYNPFAARPSRLSYLLNVEGVQQGAEIFTDASTLPLETREELWQSLQFDASASSTGRYDFEIRTRGWFETVTRTFSVPGTLTVVNEASSAFGAGWTLDGLQNLQQLPDGEVLIVEGDGSRSLFRPVGEGPIFDVAFLTADPLPGVGIRLGSAVGGFSTAAVFEGDASQVSLLLPGDFNSDSVPDLLLLNEPDSIAGEVIVLLGNPDGSLQPPVRSARTFADGIRGVRTGDFNGDSVLDLALTNDPLIPDPRLVAVLFGNGDGTFRNVSRFSPAGFGSVAAVGDFNQDSFDDLALQSGAVITAYIGNGDGTFQAGVSTGVDCFAGGVTVADVNDDSWPDLIAVETDISPPFDQFDTVCVALGNGDGTFQPYSTNTVGGGAGSPRAADFDGDSLTDLITVNRRGLDISFLKGNGDGTFQPQLSTVAAERPLVATVVHYDSDGVPDLAVSGDTSVTFMQGLGDGRFSALVQAQHGGDALSVVVDNFNQDAREQGFLSPSGDFSRLADNGDGTFTRTQKDGVQVHFDSSGRHTTSVDRNGNATTYAYNPDGTVSSVTDPAGLSTAFTYSGGKIASIVDPAGRQTLFQVDASGNLVQATDPDGAQTQYEYGNPIFPHQLTARVDPGGARTTYAYDFAGRFASSTLESAAGTIQPSLQPAAVASLVDPNSGLGSFGNPAPITRLQDVQSFLTDGNGGVWAYRFDDQGNPVEFSDPLQRTTLIDRDDNGNAVKVTRPGGSVTTFAYDSAGNLLSQTDAGIGAIAQYKYEPQFNQLVEYVDPNGNVTTITLDSSGNPVLVTDGSGNSSSSAYNSQGLVTSFTDSLGNSITLAYDSSGNLSGVTDASGNASTVQRDAAGNMISFTAPLGETWLAQYDAMNRIVQATDPNGGVTQYLYDARGNVIEVVDARGNSSFFEYDQQSRSTRYTDALGAFETVAYDLNGNLVARTDRNGNTINYQYDAADQLTAALSPSGSATYTYDANGNLTGAANQDSVLSMSYDAADRLISVSTAGSPFQPDVQLFYSYDPGGRLTSRSDSLSPDPTTYGYDASNRLVDLSLGTRTFSFGHDSRGFRTQSTFPNGVTTDYSYANNGGLTGIRHEASASVTDFGYTLDGSGYRAAQQVNRPFAGLNPSLNYQYDGFHQLTGATHPLAGLPDEFFVYDPAGNRLRRDGDPQDSVFDAANRLLEDAAYTYIYDGNGNLLTKVDRVTGETTQYSYDEENRLTGAQSPGLTANYRYDGLGRRIEKSVNGQITRYVYDGDDILYEFDGASLLTASFVHGQGEDEPLAMSRSGADYYFQADGVGSVADLTDSAGFVVQSYLYDAYGNIVASAAPLGSPSNPYGFAGREFDPETGLYFLRARYYDPVSGRFLGEDPIGFAGGTPNLYQYALNNPVNITDPDGEHFIVIVAGILIVVIVAEEVVLPLYCAFYHCEVHPLPPHTHEEHPMLPPDPRRTPACEDPPPVGPGGNRPGGNRPPPPRPIPPRPPRIPRAR